MRCRHCGEPADLVLVDLGSSPPSNAFLAEEDLRFSETWFPLRVLVCESCWLVQTEDVVDTSKLFDDGYAYFSGFSSTWVEHCCRYSEEAIRRFGLVESSRVVEVASNDGTLLKHFHDSGMNCTGIEPTASTAAAARELGLEVEEVFLTPSTADALVAKGVAADLLVANNVLAHVPDLVGFASGCRRLLADDGVASFEFPHLVKLVAETQFDTIYHEHFSYLSLRVVEAVLEAAGLTVFDVERLPIHGGSLRVYAQRSDRPTHWPVESVGEVRLQEESVGAFTRSFYLGFQDRADKIKNGLLRLLIDAAADGRRVAGYGAAAKGNTLLNYSGIRSDLLPYVVDNNPMKAGKYLPGSRIPIVSEQVLVDELPDLVLVLPWNLRAEIAERLRGPCGWTGTIATAMSGQEDI